MDGDREPAININWSLVVMQIQFNGGIGLGKRNIRSSRVAVVFVTTTCLQFPLIPLLARILLTKQ